MAAFWLPGGLLMLSFEISRKNRNGDQITWNRDRIEISQFYYLTNKWEFRQVQCLN